MVRSRAALLPTPGDPFLLEYWLNCYQHIWKPEVDELYVVVNGERSEQLSKHIYKLLHRHKAESNIFNTQMEHGRALERLLEICSTTNIMLIEDDGFIFKPGKVEECFNRLSKYDIVASKRGSCSQEILDKAAEKWDLDYSGYGDTGCNFWPNFLFMKKSLLKSIGGHFGATHWDPGEMVEGLEMRVDGECVGDTFVSASLRLREKTNNIWYEQQYHGNTDDMADYTQSKNIWDGRAAWTHVGSLSSGFANLLNLKKKLPNSNFTDQERLEFERRVVFWEIFWENADPKAIPNVHKDYRKAIDRVVEGFGLSPGRIAKRKAIYYEVLPRFR